MAKKAGAKKPTASRKGKSGEDAPERKPIADLGKTVIRWHHELAQVTGGLSMRIAKHNLVPREVQEWADRCKAVSSEMDDFVNGGSS